MKIVLDAGHGGHDAGGTYNGRREKDDNLKVTLKVGELLSLRKVEVIYTRKGDTYLSLADRTKIANDASADRFISFHRNSSANPDANGFESYVAPFAKKHGIHEAVIASGVFPNDRALREANYYVLEHTKMSATLLELGFISNADDNQRFDENLDKLATAIADSIMPKAKPTATPITILPNPLIRSLQMQLNQHGAGLAVDGILGTETMSALPLLNVGDQGDMVMLLQTALATKGFDVIPDGKFSAKTLSAVLAFQCDPVVTPETFVRLLT